MGTELSTVNNFQPCQGCDCISIFGALEQKESQLPFRLFHLAFTSACNGFDKTLAKNSYRQNTV